MKHAYVFPGQGAQFSGMGKTIYDSNEAARILLEEANDILGFRITNTMFTGSDEELKKPILPNLQFLFILLPCIKV